MFKRKFLSLLFPTLFLFSSLLILSLISCDVKKETASPSVPVEVAPTADAELRVMTFNIRYGTARDGDNHWKKRYELVFDVFRMHKPDVVGLQEALRFQLDEIRGALPQYGEVGVGRDDGKTRGEYSPIFYLKERFEVKESGTFWFSDTPEVPGSKHWGNTIPRICSWARFLDKKTQRCFYHFNVHWDHRSQPSREKSGVLLARRIKDRQHPDPFVLTGDFNAGEDNPAILYLKSQTELPGLDGQTATSEAPMADTFRVVHPKADQVGTFGGFTGRRDGPKIDYVFTSPEIIVKEAEIIHDNRDGRYPSDHYPVTAYLNLLVAPPS